jgi:hypothetical protein
MCSFRKWPLHDSGLHINNAAEFVSMGSLPVTLHDFIIRLGTGAVYYT